MKPKTKETLGASRENKKEISPADQWDVLAFKLINDELAPKGYSEIKRGPWRGKVRSNIPFLPKRSVERCQQIAAQMVRSYRGKLAKVLKDDHKELTEQLAKYRFYQFEKKWICRGMIATIEKEIQFLEQIGIK